MSRSRVARMYTEWVPLLVVCLMIGAYQAHGAKTLAGATQTEPPNPLPCVCSDIDPRSFFTKADVKYTCYEQEGGKQCDQPFMRDTPMEISEGYCQISCGRCPCCKTLGGVLDDKGYSAFKWLLGLTDVGPQLSRPGYMATLIAPHDGAVYDALKKLGYSDRQSAESYTSNRHKLQKMALLHVLPPTWDMKALWTSPFFLNGWQIPTAAKDMLTVKRSDDGKRIQLIGPSNSGWLYETDIFACKGYVQAIDTALLP